MDGRKNKKNQGFSLIELVIVVVIIGIIGAIAIPRMSRGASGATDGAVKANLAVLRNALDLYAAEHGNKYPDIADIEDALTMYSDAAGTDLQSTSSATRIYGPYLRSIPALPVGPQKGQPSASTFVGTADATPTTSSAGWVYNSTTGSVKTNSGTEKDAKGTLYTDY